MVAQRPKRSGTSGGGGGAATATSKLLLRSGSTASGVSGSGKHGDSAAGGTSAGGGRYTYSTSGDGTGGASHNGSGGVTATGIDPSQLLARGYTARFLSPYAGSGLTCLTNEEIDKDLRHFEAYRQAVLSYRQQYYVAVNHPADGGTAGANAAGVGAAGVATGKKGMRAATSPPPPPSLSLASLPVRIDVEEEKRLQQLRKKITIAEYHRENAEQQYVALRAHYVQVSQALKARVQQHADKDGEVAFLQDCLQHRSQALGLLRARLQMTRDVLHALQHRNNVLANAESAAVTSATAEVPAPSSKTSAADENAGTSKMDIDAADDGAEPSSVTSSSRTGDSDKKAATSKTDTVEAASKSSQQDGTKADGEARSTSTPQNSSAAAAAGADSAMSNTASTSGNAGDQLTDIWNKVIDDSTANIKAVSSGKGGKKKLPYRCTKLPATPHGVPLLLSAVSVAPEKSLAYAGGGRNFFGSKPQSMVWIDPDKHYIAPPCTDEEYDGAQHATTSNLLKDNNDTREVATLREEVAFLQRELENERMQNNAVNQKITSARQKSDEWVAMICLLRQETEAVLFRHNVLLDSDIATESAERLQELHEEEHEEQKQEGKPKADDHQQDVNPQEHQEDDEEEDDDDDDDEEEEEEEEEESAQREPHKTGNTGDTKGNDTLTKDTPPDAIIEEVETPAVAATEDNANDGDDEQGEEEGESEEEGSAEHQPDTSPQQRTEGPKEKEGEKASNDGDTKNKRSLEQAKEPKTESSNKDSILNEDENGNKRRRIQ